jgi:hypothetical protein
MRFTQSAFAMPRMELFLKGMLRPAAIAIPSIALLWRWSSTGVPSFNLSIGCVWVMTTLLITWIVAMSRADRNLVLQVVRGRMRLL